MNKLTTANRLEFLHDLELFCNSKYRNPRNKTEPLVLLKVVDIEPKVGSILHHTIEPKVT